jgi:hypothetical protein
MTNANHRVSPIIVYYKPSFLFNTQSNLSTNPILSTYRLTRLFKHNRPARNGAGSSLKEGRTSNDATSWKRRKVNGHQCECPPHGSKEDCEKRVAKIDIHLAVMTK